MDVFHYATEEEFAEFELYLQEQYRQRRRADPRLPEDPSQEYGDRWTSWHDFYGLIWKIDNAN